MSHWQYKPDKEDGDSDDIEEAAKTRKWLRKEASKRVHTNPLYGMLSDLELQARGLYLGEDHSEDTDDIDEMGPF